MAIQTTLDQDLVAAIKTGDELTRDTLRLLKSSLKNAEINSGQALTDEQIIAIIQKEVKKRAEAEEIYRQASKIDQADQEAKEMAILKKYVPAQLDEAAIKDVINDYLQANPTDLAQFGQAMGGLGAKLKGQADMAVVAKLLRQQLQK